MLLLGLFGQKSFATSGRSDPATLLGAADQCRNTLVASEKLRKFRHHWLNCIHRYERIIRSHPGTDEAAWALYHAGGLYVGLYRYSFESQDLDRAVELYRSLAEEYPDHRLADDGQYKIGEILYRYRKDPAKAYVEFLKVKIRYPSGDMVPGATEMLEHLEKELQKKEEEGAAQAPPPVPRSNLMRVTDIRHWSTHNYTRVVVDLSGPVSYEHHLLPADVNHQKPPRVYLDLKETRIPRDIDPVVPIPGDLLQRARAAQYDRDTVRVVLDIEKMDDYKVFHLYDPFRIVIDAHGLEKAPPPPEKAPPTKKKDPDMAKSPPSPTPEETMSLAGQLGLGVRRIVIDPGHGGKDPGCEGPGQAQEKHITLSVAKILAERLRRTGCEVFLTRDRDIFLPLERRTAIANMKKADLFISLHVNALKDRRVHGVETYFLNMATDHQAVMVAARENAASEKSISDLQAILNDLMLNTKIHESDRLARKVQEGMYSSLKRAYPTVRNLGVKQAPFYVLIGAQMPAILVEMGFITNPAEAKNLQNRAYQEKLAEGIMAGIEAYMRSMHRAAFTGS